eukprot:TRINITY_DN3989_c0_g1_i1.p1 TRINITY_DN3989_c0_g1~~TRINITY_DN3989_c0_g1_i1.p1  ORF type:complete len:397 (-),score=83.04 TRINITY_DN3989_c0_g1_i1:1313-2503(-)
MDHSMDDDTSPAMPMAAWQRGAMEFAQRADSAARCDTLSDFASYNALQPGSPFAIGADAANKRAAGFDQDSAKRTRSEVHFTSPPIFEAPPTTGYRDFTGPAPQPYFQPPIEASFEAGPTSPVGVEVPFGVQTDARGGLKNATALTYRFIMPGNMRITGVLWANELWQTSDARMKSDIQLQPDCREQLQHVRLYRYKLHTSDADRNEDAAGNTNASQSNNDVFCYSTVAETISTGQQSLDGNATGSRETPTANSGTTASRVAPSSSSSSCPPVLLSAASGLSTDRYQLGVLAQDIQRAGLHDVVMDTGNGLCVNGNALTALAVDAAVRNYQDLQALRPWLSMLQQVERVPGMKWLLLKPRLLLCVLVMVTGMWSALAPVLWRGAARLVKELMKQRW